MRRKQHWKSKSSSGYAVNVGKVSVWKLHWFGGNSKIYICLLGVSLILNDLLDYMYNRINMIVNVSRMHVHPNCLSIRPQMVGDIDMVWLLRGYGEDYGRDIFDIFAHVWLGTYMFDEHYYNISDRSMLCVPFVKNRGNKVQACVYKLKSVFICPLYNVNSLYKNICTTYTYDGCFYIYNYIYSIYYFISSLSYMYINLLSRVRYNVDSLKLFFCKILNFSKEQKLLYLCSNSKKSLKYKLRVNLKPKALRFYKYAYNYNYYLIYLIGYRYCYNFFYSECSLCMHNFSYFFKNVCSIYAMNLLSVCSLIGTKRLPHNRNFVSYCPHIGFAKAAQHSHVLNTGFIYLKFGDLFFTKLYKCIDYFIYVYSKFTYYRGLMFFNSFSKGYINIIGYLRKLYIIMHIYMHNYNANIFFLYKYSILSSKHKYRYNTNLMFKLGKIKHLENTPIGANIDSSAKAILWDKKIRSNSFEYYQSILWSTYLELLSDLYRRVKLIYEWVTIFYERVKSCYYFYIHKYSDMETNQVWYQIITTHIKKYSASYELYLININIFRNFSAFRNYCHLRTYYYGELLSILYSIQIVVQRMRTLYRRWPRPEPNTFSKVILSFMCINLWKDLSCTLNKNISYYYNKINMFKHFNAAIGNSIFYKKLSLYRYFIKNISNAGLSMHKEHLTENGVNIFFLYKIYTRLVSWYKSSNNLILYVMIVLYKINLLLCKYKMLLKYFIDAKYSKPLLSKSILMVERLQSISKVVVECKYILYIFIVFTPGVYSNIHSNMNVLEVLVTHLKKIKDSYKSINYMGVTINMFQKACYLNYRLKFILYTYYYTLYYYSVGIYSVNTVYVYFNSLNSIRNLYQKLMFWLYKICNSVILGRVQYNYINSDISVNINNFLRSQVTGQGGSINLFSRNLLYYGSQHTSMARPDDVLNYNTLYIYRDPIIILYRHTYINMNTHSNIFSAILESYLGRWSKLFLANIKYNYLLTCSSKYEVIITMVLKVYKHLSYLYNYMHSLKLFFAYFSSFFFNGKSYMSSKVYLSMKFIYNRLYSSSIFRLTYILTYLNVLVRNKIKSATQYKKSCLHLNFLKSRLDKLKDTDLMYLGSIPVFPYKYNYNFYSIYYRYLGRISKTYIRYIHHGQLRHQWKVIRKNIIKIYLLEYFCKKTMLLSMEHKRTLLIRQTFKYEYFLLILCFCFMYRLRRKVYVVQDTHASSSIKLMMYLMRTRITKVSKLPYLSLYSLKKGYYKNSLHVRSSFIRRNRSNMPFVKHSGSVVKLEKSYYSGEFIPQILNYIINSRALDFNISLKNLKKDCTDVVALQQSKYRHRQVYNYKSHVRFINKKSAYIYKSWALLIYSFMKCFYLKSIISKYTYIINMLWLCVSQRNMYLYYLDNVIQDSITLFKNFMLCPKIHNKGVKGLQHNKLYMHMYKKSKLIFGAAKLNYYRHIKNIYLDFFFFNILSIIHNVSSNLHVYTVPYNFMASHIFVVNIVISTKHMNIFKRSSIFSSNAYIYMVELFLKFVYIIVALTSNFIGKYIFIIMLLQFQYLIFTDNIYRFMVMSTSSNILSIYINFYKLYKYLRASYIFSIIYRIYEKIMLRSRIGKKEEINDIFIKVARLYGRSNRGGLCMRDIRASKKDRENFVVTIPIGIFNIIFYVNYMYMRHIDIMCAYSPLNYMSKQFYSNSLLKEKIYKLHKIYYTEGDYLPYYNNFTYKRKFSHLLNFLYSVTLVGTTRLYKDENIKLLSEYRFWRYYLHAHLVEFRRTRLLGKYPSSYIPKRISYSWYFHLQSIQNVISMEYYWYKRMVYERIYSNTLEMVYNIFYVFELSHESLFWEDLVYLALLYILHKYIKHYLVNLFGQAYGLQSLNYYPHIYTNEDYLDPPIIDPDFICKYIKTAIGKEDTLYEAISEMRVWISRSLHKFKTFSYFYRKGFRSRLIDYRLNYRVPLVRSVKIEISGRVHDRRRTVVRMFKLGWKTTTSRVKDRPLQYSSLQGQSTYGVFGIKVWVFLHHQPVRGLVK